MTKTDISIYRGLKEKFDPEVHIGFFIASDTGELLIGDQSLGQTISGWEINNGVLTLLLNTGKDINVTFPEATETVKGLLSAADKAQLVALQANLDSKVDKVTGKSLVEDALITKLTQLPTSDTLTLQLSDAKAAGDNAQSDLNAHKQNKSNPHLVTKAQVGLGNVTNDAQVKRSEMGVANGVATLDADGKVPAAQLPSYVDDIVDVYATYTKSSTGVLSDITLYSDVAKTKLVTGEAGKIYQNVATGEPNYLFRWTGTVFSLTGASSLIIGEVAGTAYDGAKGKTNADNIAKIQGTKLSHINDETPITTTASKVTLNYECFTGAEYGSAGAQHTADIPAATTTRAGVMSSSDKTILSNLSLNKTIIFEFDSDTLTESLFKSSEFYGWVVEVYSKKPYMLNVYILVLGKTYHVDSIEGLNKLNPSQIDNIVIRSSVSLINGNNVEGLVGYRTSRGSSSSPLFKFVQIRSFDGVAYGMYNSVSNFSDLLGGYIDATQVGAFSHAKVLLPADLLVPSRYPSDVLYDFHIDTNPASLQYSTPGDGFVDEYHILVRTNMTSTGDLIVLHKRFYDVPSGGHERQILSWESDGKAKWEDMSNLFTGLEELLAYGVEWDVTVSDPHITRIGNMSLHKTLPIQSQLKGCIAQNDKVIYWLDENDWRFRKDPILKATSLENDVEFATVDSVEGLAVGQFVRANGHIGKIYAIENTTLNIEWEEDLGDISADLTTVTKIEIGSRLDGYDGTVRVYCPNFYIKSQIIGNKRRVWLSTVKIDNTWTYQHEILIDAYRCTVLTAVPENMGYLSTLPVSSAVSIVNTATYCRGGGNRSANDEYLETDPFRTDLGKPRTNQPRSTFRTECRNAGNEMLSYDLYKNIFYWLYVVEYANFNCQEAYNADLTDDGYHQGGLGAGVTTWSAGQWNAYNYSCPITPCGYGNDLGNKTGIKTINIPETTSGSTTIAAKTFDMPRWRGFDNPFGDIWTNLDGIIIDADADNHPNNMNYVYTCQDPTKYADNLNGEGYEKVGEEIHQDGYTKLFDLGDAAHIIPNVMGGTTTLFKCDYHWTGSKNTTLRTRIVGGYAYDGAAAGLGSFYSISGVSISWDYVGFRSVSRFVSFSSQE